MNDEFTREYLKKVMVYEKAKRKAVYKLPAHFNGISWMVINRLISIKQGLSRFSRRGK